jgi:hypothetical protein
MESRLGKPGPLRAKGNSRTLVNRSTLSKAWVRVATSGNLDDGGT